MARRDEVVECRNCSTENDEDSKYCKKCGSNLRTRKYSKDDDPMDRLDEMEEKLDRLIAWAEEDNEDEEGANSRGRTRSKERIRPKGKRRTLFG